MFHLACTEPHLQLKAVTCDKQAVDFLKPYFVAEQVRGILPCGVSRNLHRLQAFKCANLFSSPCYLAPQLSGADLTFSVLIPDEAQLKEACERPYQ